MQSKISPDNSVKKKGINYQQTLFFLKSKKKKKFEPEKCHGLRKVMNANLKKILASSEPVYLSNVVGFFN